MARSRASSEKSGLRATLRIGAARRAHSSAACATSHATATAPWRSAWTRSRETATWLLERAPRAVAFDFPQDYTIRRLLQGEVRPIEEHVTHDILLRKG
jgi:kynurenine formamidase